MQGFSKKLVTQYDQPIQYFLPLGESSVHLNPYIGRHIKLSYSGNIECSHCGRTTKKSFSQGFCYPCFKKLPQCDLCMMSPERCHFSLGTCRDETFGQDVCMQPHIVYLANSSGLKVGITKPSQIPTRWIDQGALQAIPLFQTQSRQIAGFIEVVIKQHISDKTHWQRMLKGQNVKIDLLAARQDVLSKIENELSDIDDKFGLTAYQLFENEEEVGIEYPVEVYPTKVSSLSFDKRNEIEGTLQGIKGQYLIFDIGVINMRKFSSYELKFEASTEDDSTKGTGNLF